MFQLAPSVSANMKDATVPHPQKQSRSKIQRHPVASSHTESRSEIAQRARGMLLVTNVVYQRVPPFP